MTTELKILDEEISPEIYQEDVQQAYKDGYNKAAWIYFLIGASLMYIIITYLK